MDSTTGPIGEIADTDRLHSNSMYRFFSMWVQHRRAEGVGFLWMEQQSRPHQLGGLGRAVSSTSGVRGQRFSTIFSTQEAYPDTNVVNCGLSCSHWAEDPRDHFAYAPRFTASLNNQTRLDFLRHIKFRGSLTVYALRPGSSSN